MTHEAGLARFNELNKPALLRILLEVCQSPAWRNDLCDNRPYPDVDSLLESSDKFLADIAEIEIEESLINHPRIGAQNAGPRSAREQSRFASTIDEAAFAEFAALNQQYEDKFGFLFLIAAEGRSASEIMDVLKDRLKNDAATERGVMRVELAKINRLRLQQLLSEDVFTVSSNPNVV
jgi:2-oxo-4-hydroxy-4-carboxy-5-ureidoimidazoline decarboxylase